MHKLISIAICLSSGQITFAQNQKLEVDGVIVISNNEDPNPAAETIRWTGQDFFQNL